MRRLREIVGERAGLTCWIGGLLLAAAVPALAQQTAPASRPAASQPGSRPTVSGDAAAVRRAIEERLRRSEVPATQKAPSSRAIPRVPRTEGPTAPHAARSAQLERAHPPATASAPVPPAVEPETPPKPTLDLEPPPPDQPQPRWTCEKPTLDSPPVWSGDAARYAFSVANAGAGVLNFELQACCGAKVIGPEQRTLAPGDSATVEIVAMTGTRGGEYTKQIRAYTNDSENRIVQLTCTGRVLIPYTLDPPDANFGNIPRDAGPVTRTLKLTRADAPPLKPSLREPRGSNVTSVLRELVPGDVYEIDVTISPPWPSERLTGSVTVDTGFEKSPAQTVRVFAHLEPRLKAEPARFLVPHVVEEDLELKARLVWSGPPARVTKVTSTEARLQPELREEDGAQFVVLRIPAGYERGPQTTTAVTAYTDDEVAKHLRIPISTKPRMGVAAEQGTPASTPASSRPTQSERR